MLRLFKYIIFITPFLTFAKMDLRYSPLGEPRIKFSTDDVIVKIKKYSNVNIKAIIDPSSFEWVRFEKTLLVPRARLKIKVESPRSDFYIIYKDKTTSFQQSAKNSYGEIYYSLYEREKVYIYFKEKIIGEVIIQFNKHKKEKVIIDYTCSRNNIVINGLEDEHFSIGCHTRRIGQFGKEKPLLEIQWVSPELKIIDSSYVPYKAAFVTQRPVNILVKNIYTGKTKTIRITARIPKRLHRLFTAYGFGPYALHTKITDPQTQEDSTIHTNIAPALFFYLNYKISETTSIRGFDAAIFQESKFNNAGLYLGSDFGFSLDNKLYFTTLLGVQYLYFKFSDDSPEVSEPIFPQGIEFMYRHAFDIPNYIISGGIFLSTDREIEYENVWIRWGKNYFWELNLISWGKEEFEAKTWGLSVGFPFKGFL